MSDLHSILYNIRHRAADSDRTGHWPDTDLTELASIGAMRWAVPADAGGSDLSALDLHLHYESIASASLATALILSQRDSAVGLIDGADNAELRAELLPALSVNKTFSTVGIAQLTTSRQGGPPALLASPIADGFQLDGLIPWVTGADRADFIVSAASVTGGGQILFVLPTDRPGVLVAPAMPLVALAATHTTSIRCDGVIISSSMILRGPCERALAARRKGLAIGQAFLGMGLVRGAIDLIHSHDSDRAREIKQEFEEQLLNVRQRVIAFCSDTAPDSAQAPMIRGNCNDLAVRVTHSAVALYKGTALTMDHPAQRLAREAMFLLVWSCPDPVIDCTVERLSST
ncbi:MAG: acyl-CoA/acyl-ACP dehydrogenase [Phycisphaerae bacterium]|nr:acyl-CoA/acyl-ACP dehydrogenase [Phycisphaerae bacterium]